MFDAAHQLRVALEVARGVLTTTEIHPQRMRDALEPAMLATDLAEHLVRKHNVPFRETHHVAGAAVRLAEKENTTLAGLSKAQLATLHPAFENDSDADVAALWDFDRSAESRDAQGGTSIRAQKEQVAALSAWHGTGDDVPKFTVENNTVLFTWKYDPIATHGGDCFRTEKVLATLTNNVFGYGDYYGINNQSGGDLENLTLVNNAFCGNLMADYLEFDTKMAVADMEDEADKLSDAEDNVQVKLTGLKVNEDWAKNYATRNVIDRMKAEESVQALGSFTNDLRSMLGLPLPPSLAAALLLLPLLPPLPPSLAAGPPSPLPPARLPSGLVGHSTSPCSSDPRQLLVRSPSMPRSLHQGQV